MSLLQHLINNEKSKVPYIDDGVKQNLLVVIEGANYLMELVNFYKSEREKVNKYCASYQIT